MADIPVRTRFAPSPTGFLHVGGVRTALFAWLVAKQAGGQFILRIEDTDRDRHVEESEQHIIDSLEWLGLKPDEGPFRQSERLEIYKEWAQRLIDSGRAYADTTSTEDLDELREASKQARKPFLFREHRPESPPEWQPGMPLRFKSEPKARQWHDEVMGDLNAGEEAIDDFILIKSDGFPTYNFAHIIDDHLMGITHVIRSQEFLPSVPKFLDLYGALGIEQPRLATLPYVLGPDGHKKLSKRDGAKDILDYKREGYLAEALISFLATLGWNDGSEQEIFTVDELIKKFDLSRVQRGGAKFDEQRLAWVDGHFIRDMEVGNLFELARDFWPHSAKEYSFEYKFQILKLVQERLKHLSELSELTDFFFDKDYSPNRDLILSAARMLDNPERAITEVIDDLEQSDFSSEDLNQRLKNLVGKLNVSPRELFGLIRVTVTGKTIAPGLWETLHVLSMEIGKEGVLQRLKGSLDIVKD